MITRLMLSNGDVLYPNFLSVEERKILRDKMTQEGLKMRCSCRTDVNLLYGVSSDYKIYPLHNDYEHASWCSRNHQSDERNTAFVYEDDGKSTVFLTFDPRVFTPAHVKAEVERQENAEEYINEYDDDTVSLPESGPGKKKEMLPRCNLKQLITTINHDTYAERIMTGKNAVLSEDYFKTAMLARCKKVYPSGMSKSLRALSLEEDKVSFIYGKVAACEEAAVFIYGSEGNAYRRFVPSDVMARAQKAFIEAYGLSVADCMEEQLSVYVSGFAYKKISRSGSVYVCFGRLCFFLVTKNGLIANSELEYRVLQKIFSFARTCGGVFMFPDSDKAEHFGVLRIPKQKKEGRIYLKKAPTKDVGAVLCVSEEPTDERLQKFVEDICF